jgi:hypothetical protein
MCIAELKLNDICSSYLFRSGNAEHPSDRFYNTSVEVLPVSSHTSSSRIDYNATNDGFVIIGLCIIVTLCGGMLNYLRHSTAGCTRQWKEKQGTLVTEDHKFRDLPGSPSLGLDAKMEMTSVAKFREMKTVSDLTK